ncbi:MAG: protein-disulfide reductase DsbD [Pseudomonadota bacterium]
MHRRQSFRPSRTRSGVACLLLLLAAPVLLSVSTAQADDWLEDEPEFLPVDQAFRFSAETNAEGDLVARWQMPDGYYLYRHQFGVEAAPATGLELGEARIPPGKKKVDEYFGEVEVYYHQAELAAAVSGGRGVQTVAVNYQGCADYGLCYPPETRQVRLDFTGPTPMVLTAADAAAGGEPADPAGANGAAEAAGAAGLTGPLTEEQRLAGRLEQGSMLGSLLIFFLAGLGLAFTPCVLPMVPILSSIIVGEAASITRARAFSLSLAYVLGMAVTYAALGTLVGLFGASLNLQAALQSPPVLITFAIVFALLSLSMFGFYELQLPQRWQNGLNQMGDKVGGGKHFSVLVMGSLSALVVSPCVSAPLAGALIYLSTTGDALLGGTALLALGLGMGVPLLLIGASGGHLLPRAGVWMDGVKAVFGVLLLGVAVWLLERVVPASVTLALWAALAIGAGVYLGALDFSARQGWGQLRKAGGAFSFVYGVLLLIGAASGANDPLKPLALIAGSGAGGAQQQAEQEQWLAVDGLTDVERQLAEARAAGVPVLLDLYADWCISCKVMERSVFPKPAVLARLNQFRLLRADVTANTAEHKALLNRFGLFGPPSIVFFDRTGSPLPEVTLQGELGADAFAAHLDRVLDRAASGDAIAAL